MAEYIYFDGLSEENKYIRYFIELNEETYVFIVRWNTYCNCAFLSIFDYNNNSIITSRALVNGLIIRNKNLPYNFIFTQVNDETYEPTLENISKEFALVYETEEDSESESE